MSFPTLTEDQLLHQCAESKVYAFSDIEGIEAIAKVRIAKAYRQPQLDVTLRRRRTTAESRILAKCSKMGVRVPKLLGTDEANYTIYMERLVGVTAKEFLQKHSDVEAARAVCRAIGGQLGLLHDNDIIHGDLTTSNFFVLGDAPSSVAVIDFGLAVASTRDEDRAVDLYVLERAFAATHPGSDILLKFVDEGYAAASDPNKYEITMKKLAEVRMRGRKRTMIG
eukprot:PhM_4_TR6266/c0_g1_i1/m.83098/K08851/TP53RK, PRPK, BUD32; TP53 regulating kinase and related kinases